MLGKLLGPDIEEMLGQKRLRELRDVLREIPPHDIADLIGDLSDDQRAIVFRILPRALASDVFEQMSVDGQEALLAGLSQEQCRQIIGEMDPDDRTALLEELPARVTRKILRLLSAEERQVAQTLLAYPENSIGRLMTPDYIDLRAGTTAGEALEFIRQVGMDKETVYACYVTRPGHILEGVVSLKNLVLAPANAPVKDLMRDPPAVVHTNEDQAKAARAMSDYDLLAVPVVDSDRRLVGIVTVDDAIDVLEEEATDDLQVMAGVLPETDRSYLSQRVLGISWRRGLPLLGLVLGECLSAFVLHGFGVQIQSLVALTFFIPMVMATGGGTGVQTATLIVRGFSTHEIQLRDFLRVLLREIAIGLLLGLFLGGVAFGLCYIISQNAHGSVAISGEMLPKIGLIVAATMLLVMFLGVVAGVLLPMMFQALKLDPAVMTSPFLTTTTDVLGLVIYFSVATWILRT